MGMMMAEPKNILGEVSEGDLSKASRWTRIDG